MITGEYKNSLDDKGRLLIPSKLRTELEGERLVLTRGVETCLWLFPLAQWTSLAEQLTQSTSLFQKRARILKRRIIAPAQEVEIDKAGRITIPPTLREYADLIKDTVILGLENYMEIWNESSYQEDLDSNEDEFMAAAEELGKILSL
ncbi:division/cell wall cluster transcriptional repressor MraZ [Marispirochaeta sp.]|jgi:MraZ protein|uniref:division/cell wall cluster transcriptional repressor MraZ n=1 Tax=Marispirochaeta sp. TaxID=2038653 RepID=UPI0029C862D7|nr:division/cell wall cluster transcriptional repressor MraZ [Marispirochaeta sp.]